MLLTGANPINTYKAIFEGSGLNWLFPWVTGDDRTIAALNLQQTLIITTPLILTGLAVAFAFRGGLFNIGGQGQYLVGSDRRGLGRLVVRRACRRCCTSCSRSPRACVVGGVVGGHRRPAEGDDRRQRGDLDDHAQLDGDLPRRRTCSGSAGRCRTTTRAVGVPVSNDVVAGREAAGVLGRPASCRACTSASSSRSRALLVFWVMLNRTTPATRSARSASTRTRPQSAASASAATTSW